MSRCSFCGSSQHSYKHHYPPASQKLYNSLLEKWRNFLISEIYVVYPQGKEHREVVEDLYDDLVDKFCKLYSYSEGLEEMAFYDNWNDTFKDEFYKKVHNE